MGGCDGANSRPYFISGHSRLLTQVDSAAKCSVAFEEPGSAVTSPARSFKRLRDNQKASQSRRLAPAQDPLRNGDFTTTILDNECYLPGLSPSRRRCPDTATAQLNYLGVTSG